MSELLDRVLQRNGCCLTTGSLLFVYGTLQRGEINFPHWLGDGIAAAAAADGGSSGARDVLYLGTAVTVKPMWLYTNPPTYLNCSPCLVEPCPLRMTTDEDAPRVQQQEGYPVHGELLWVSHARRALLDQLEGVATKIYTPIEMAVTAHLASHHLSSPSSSSYVNSAEGETENHNAFVAVSATVYLRTAKCPTVDDPNGDTWEVVAPSTDNKNIPSNKEVTSGKHPLQLWRQFSAVRSLAHAPSVYRCLPAHMVPSFHLRAPCDATKTPMVLVILDGIGDTAVPEFHGRTPLEEAARLCPSLSLITQNGLSGLMDPVSPGRACGSDTAHLSMLGYDPHDYYRGRGAFESLGAGMDMVPNEDIAFKCNFSTWEPSTNVVTARRCDRNFTAEGPVLCDALDGVTVERDSNGVLLEHGPHRVRAKYATEHRLGLTIQGLGLSDEITGTDPLSDGRLLVECRPSFSEPTTADGAAALQRWERALYTCRVVEAVSKKIHQLLSAHPINQQRVQVERKPPANIVLLRGAAMRSDVPSFEARHGLRGFVVAPTCIIRGLCRCCGLEVIESEGGTGDYHSNIPAKADAVLRTFANDSSFHFGILHVKGVDDAGHDGSATIKRDMLLQCGEALRKLWDGLPVGSTVAVTGDHSTPIAMEDHSTEVVPFSIATKKLPSSSGNEGMSSSGCWRADGCQRFSELECGSARASLGRFPGSELMNILKAVHYGVPA